MTNERTHDPKKILDLADSVREAAAEDESDEPIVQKRTGVDVDAALETAIQTVRDSKDGPDMAIVKRVLSSLGDEIPVHVAEAVAKSLGEAIASRIFVDPRLKEMEEQYRSLAQHALNVVVAFQIRTRGTTISIVGGFEAKDAETAISVSEIKLIASQLGCQGASLAAQDSHDEPEAPGVPQQGRGFGGIF
jgi:translation initiation factor 1 (eIF-1/SUI1)